MLDRSMASEKLTANQKLSNMKDQFTKQVVGEDPKPIAGQDMMDAINQASQRPEGYHWTDAGTLIVAGGEPKEETIRVVNPDHEPSNETMEKFANMVEPNEPQRAGEVAIKDAIDAGASQGRKGMLAVMQAYLADAQTKRAQGKIALSDDFLNGMATMYHKALEVEQLANNAESE